MQMLHSSQTAQKDQYLLRGAADLLLPDLEGEADGLELDDLEGVEGLLY